MPVFRKFDPYALVQGEVAAKAAKPAKAELPEQNSFSKFSHFREGGHLHEVQPELEHAPRCNLDIPPELDRRPSEPTGLAEADARSWPASAWQELYRIKLEFWTLPRRDAHGFVTRHLNAHVLAWSHLQNLWHKHHWERPASGICGGCGGPIGGADSLDLGGYQVHLGRDLDCLTVHGGQWRSAADAALKALGLVPPTEDK
jgi:hypothetical protein